MKILITGGCGFLGSNVAKKSIERGDIVLIFDNLSRVGSEKNLVWLKQFGDFEFLQKDICSVSDVEGAISTFLPDAVFHFAGQVAMTTSIENPRRDFEINALGTLNVLEAVRKHKKDCVVIYSSTNKVYGDLEWVTYGETKTRYVAENFPNGFPEDITLNFSSPYGCSKGSADQYVLDYHKVFGLKTIVFRHSSMYGGRQFATYDQGWIGWFCQKAVEKSQNPKAVKFTISGNGKQVRDVLFADDMVDLYLKALSNIDIISGQCFNVGGGIDNSLSLLELLQLLESELGVKLDYEQLPARQSDQKVFVADISKIKKAINWVPKTNKNEGIRKMIAWIKQIS